MVLVGQPLHHPRFVAEARIEGINVVYREYAAARSQVSYVDAGRNVEQPTGAYTDRLPCTEFDQDCGPDGTTVVRGDGVHFCPVVGVHPCPVWSSGAARFGLGIAAGANDPATLRLTVGVPSHRGAGGSEVRRLVARFGRHRSAGSDAELRCPSGSVRVTQEKSPALRVPRLVAPAAVQHATSSSSGPSVWMSRCTLFFPGVGSSTRWNASWVGRLPPATMRKKPSMLAVISASKRSAHQWASGSGSALSNVMEAMLTVMVSGCHAPAAPRRAGR